MVLEKRGRMGWTGWMPRAMMMAAQLSSFANGLWKAGSMFATRFFTLAMQRDDDTIHSCCRWRDVSKVRLNSGSNSQQASSREVTWVGLDQFASTHECRDDAGRAKALVGSLQEREDGINLKGEVSKWMSLLGKEWL